MRKEFRKTLTKGEEIFIGNNIRKLWTNERLGLLLAKR